MSEQEPDNLTWKQLYRLSKYPYQETFLEATLQQMGINQSRFMEQITRNKNYLKTQSTIQPVIMFIYSAILIIFPIIAFQTIQAEIRTDVATHWIFFAGSFAIGLFSLISLGYILLFGLMQSSALVSGNAFKFLSTLPIAEQDLQRTVMLTFFRGVQTQIIVSLVMFPIGIAIATANALVVLLGVCISTISLLFAFSVLILVGGRVNRILQGNDVNTTKASIIRVATMLGIGLGSVFIIFVLQFAFLGIFTFFLPPPLTPGGFDLLNIIMSLIPFPFAGNYLLAEVFIAFIGGQSVPPELWLTSTIGFILFILITRSMFRKAVKTLRNVIYFEPRKSSISKPSTVKPVKVVVISPVRAFIKKDLSSATRDYQTLMSIIAPLIFSLIGILAMGNSGAVLDSFFVFGINTLYLFLGAVIITYGLMNAESSGASVLASLPMFVRDQALGKVIIMLVVTIIAALIPYFLIFSTMPLDQVIALLVVSLPLGPIFGLIGLEMKAFLFGKLKYQYILEEFNRDFKIAKLIAIGLVELGVFGVVFLTMRFLGANLVSFGIPCLLGEGGTIAILAIIFNKMFPKEGKGHA